MSHQIIDLSQLKSRFLSHMHHHPTLSWDDVLHAIQSNPKSLETIQNMEQSGGEPDVIMMDGALYYADFSKETPAGRRNVCYDEKARTERKKFPPAASAQAMAEAMGAMLMDEKTYRFIQALEPLDLKTSSWLKTPDSIRSLGGALFGDRRYDHVFVYHNGADSYYGVRGFRVIVCIKP